MSYPKPYYRKQRQSWCVQLGPKDQRTLVHGPRAETEAEAWRRYHALMTGLGREVPAGDLTLTVAFDMFLEHARATVKPASFDQYRIKLQDLADRIGQLRLSELRASHVAEWLAARDWSDSTKRGAITALKVCVAWCTRRKFLAEDPLKGVKRPRMGRRERIVSPEERARIRDEFDDGFGDFLDALGWTGARPGEIMRLEARHVDQEATYASLPGKTTDATGDPIEFPLVPPMLELCRRLAEANPTGPLFRNRDGDPWTENAVRCRMRRMRERLDIKGVVAYTYRHSFATDALERGVPLADVAALMNHKDIRTTMNYNHVNQRKEHLRRQAEKAVGGGGEGAPVTPSV
jgi:integrase